MWDWLPDALIIAGLVALAILVALVVMFMCMDVAPVPLLGPDGRPMGKPRRDD